VKDQLAQALYGMQVQKALESLVKELREKASIEVLTPVEKVSLK
jgi:hypothetical protein